MLLDRSVMHSNRSVAKRLGRDQFELSGAGQPPMIEGRSVAGDPWVDKKFVVVD